LEPLVLEDVFRPPALELLLLDLSHELVQPVVLVLELSFLFFLFESFLFLLFESVLFFLFESFLFFLLESFLFFLFENIG
jgi:hypothetical protein